MDIREFLAALFKQYYRPAKVESSLKETSFVYHVRIMYADFLEVTF
jgi:hypothetical protein